MSKKQLKLNVQPEEKKIVIGISCHENDYRISWALNDKIQLCLKRSDNHRLIETKSGLEQEFALYSYFSDEPVLYYLVSNISEKGFLIDEYKNIDFLFVIVGEISQSKLNTLLQQIKEIEIVSTAFLLSLKKNTSKNRLHFT